MLLCSTLLVWVRVSTHESEIVFKMFMCSQLHLFLKTWIFSSNYESASIVVMLLKMKHDKYYLTEGGRNFSRIEGNELSALFGQEL